MDQSGTERRKYNGLCVSPSIKRQESPWYLPGEKSDDVTCVHIRQEPWGAGETGDVPLYGKKPEAALRDLAKARLPQARNTLQEQGTDAYYPLGKIQNLAKITTADCDLIERLMTKYCRFEHSQSSEAPVEVPEPDELKADIRRLIEWHNEFTKRPI